MSIRLLYVGAAVELAPAASLRALGGGAVLLPRDLPADLVELVTGALGGPPAGEFGIDDVQAVCEQGAAGTVTLCIAGSRGPALARAVRAHARARGLPLETVPDAAAFDDCLVAPGAHLAASHHGRAARAVPVGPRAARHGHRVLHDRRGLRARRSDHGRAPRRRARRARRRALPGLLPEPPARRAARRRPGQRGRRDRDQAHPPPRAHLRRRGRRDGERGARRVGTRQARLRGPRGRVPQRARNAARAAAGA